MKSNKIFLFLTLILQFNTFTIRRIIGTSLQDCRVKFHDRDWQDIKDCDQTDFDPGWSGGDVSSDLNIDYNLGDKIFVWIKVFNKLPENYENYCCIYFNLFINEYYIGNTLDYIYYCSNCDCTDSLGEKTFCHKWDDKRLYCTPVRGKEYQFYFMINGYNELNLMYAATELTDFYKIIGADFYLTEEETKEIKFSSNSILKSNYYSQHKVILDELSIKYSFEGQGEFRTINDEILPSSGEIGSDIIFIKPNNITGNETFNTKLTVQTISKFGKDKGKNTSEPSEFNFYFCAPEYKMHKNGSCYKCFESCFDCSEPGNDTNHQCDKCNHQNPYYFYLNDTKNCFKSCKSANKIRIEKAKHLCIDADECETYISSDEESCILNCTSEFEYFDNRTGNVSKICLNNCDDYISNDNTVCLDSCKRINQLINNITANKQCTTENMCSLYKKYIDSNNNYCIDNCSLVSELQDYRYKDYRPYCLSYTKCDSFISYDETKCIQDCPSEFEYFDDRKGTRSKLCLKKEMCDSWISSNDTICLNDCKFINELSDLTGSTLCLDSCERINQFMTNIKANKQCTTENKCILNKKFIDSNNNYCIDNCSLVSELQDYRYKDYRPYCLSYTKCDSFISYDETKCIQDCPSEFEYFDDRKGTRSKLCLKKEMCDSWISSNDTICLNDCKFINELSDLTSHLCANFCHKDLFYTPELMICDKQCNVPYKFYITYENKTKKCVKKCDEFPYLVLDEDTFECLPFNKFEIMSIQTNPMLNSNKEKFPTYFVNKYIKNLTVKVTFNQNIRKRIQLINGTYERIYDDNNSIIFRVAELKGKKTFNFSDNINNSYYFGFELETISYVNLLLVILIIICAILLILLIVLWILH